MQNTREWYEARALELETIALSQVGQAGHLELGMFTMAQAQLHATLANAADRRSHGSITDPPIRHTNEG